MIPILWTGTRPLPGFCLQPLFFSLTALHGLESPKPNPLAGTFLLILGCYYYEFSEYK